LEITGIRETEPQRYEPYTKDDDKLVDGVLRIILDIRKQARISKNFALSDQIRDGLNSLGIKVIDTPEATRWSKSDE
jgi:cysteinyl-tRNA synthetase